MAVDPIGFDNASTFRQGSWPGSKDRVRNTTNRRHCALPSPRQSAAGCLRRACLVGLTEGRVNDTMTIVAAIVAVLLLGYLVVALVRPEKF